jgi:hypothetical protein
MKSILIEEAYRAIKVRDGSREVTITGKTSLNDERRSASSARILSRIQTTSLSM